MRDNEYQCAQCGRVFEKGWSDEEAEKEASKNFGDQVNKESMSVVCDDCYKEIMDIKHN